MPIGSRRKRGSDEYVFIDGKAMTADEAIRIELTAQDTASVPGMEQATMAPGQEKPRGKRSWSAKRALKELESSDAFALNDEIELGAISKMMAEEKRKKRRMYLIMFAVLVLVVVFNLCISVDHQGSLYSPLLVIQVIAKRVQVMFASLFGLSWYDPATTLVAINKELPGYADICSRIDVTLVTLVCGFLLALSGMMYQNVFKNPIAAPSMLGVSAGVRIGTIVLVLMFGEAALQMNGTRYLYCYIGGVVIILLVIGFSKLIAGKGRRVNVVDMLIVGSVLSQLLATISTYFLTEIMDDETYEVFYEITSGARTDVGLMVYALLAIVLIISVVPVFLMRFRLNTVAFDDGDARLLGVNPERLRVFVLVMGTIMILAAQIHVGVISMVALVVPFLTRYLVGSEFGKQMVGNMILGPASLLVCRAICALVPFVGAGLSLEMVVGFVALPLYIWMMALGKKGWE